MSDETTVIDETTEETQETAEGQETQETEGQENGRKKHAKPLVYVEVDGEQVLAERVWTSHLFPQQMVRDFAQYARDTDRKPTDITSEILAAGMVAVFAEVARTKDERDAARAAKTLPSDADVLARQEEALAKRMAALEEKMAAIRAKAQAARAGNGSADLSSEVEGDAEVDAMIAEIEETATSTGKAHGRSKK